MATSKLNYNRKYGTIEANLHIPDNERFTASPVIGKPQAFPTARLAMEYLEKCAAAAKRTGDSGIRSGREKPLKGGAAEHAHYFPGSRNALPTERRCP